MYKKFLNILFLLVFCFSLTGCGNKKVVEKRYSNDKVFFTVQQEDKEGDILYKVPENFNLGSFEDQGSICSLEIKYFEDYVVAFDQYEDELNDMGEKVINGSTYEWWKKDGTYKYKIIKNINGKNRHYMFIYDCNNNYDHDDQVDAFMSTVEYGLEKE